MKLNVLHQGPQYKYTETYDYNTKNISVNVSLIPTLGGHYSVRTNYRIIFTHFIIIVLGFTTRSWISIYLNQGLVPSGGYSNCTLELSQNIKHWYAVTKSMIGFDIHHFNLYFTWYIILNIVIFILTRII